MESKLTFALVWLLGSLQTLDWEIQWEVKRRREAEALVQSWRNHWAGFVWMGKASLVGPSLTLCDPEWWVYNYRFDPKLKSPFEEALEAMWVEGSGWHGDLVRKPKQRRQNGNISMYCWWVIISYNSTLSWSLASLQPPCPWYESWHQEQETPDDQRDLFWGF